MRLIDAEAEEEDFQDAQEEPGSPASCSASIASSNRSDGFKDASDQPVAASGEVLFLCPYSSCKALLPNHSTIGAMKDRCGAGGGAWQEDGIGGRV